MDEIYEERKGKKYEKNISSISYHSYLIVSLFSSFAPSLYYFFPFPSVLASSSSFTLSPFLLPFSLPVSLRFPFPPFVITCPSLLIFPLFFLPPFFYYFFPFPVFASSSSFLSSHFSSSLFPSCFFTFSFASLRFHISFPLPVIYFQFFPFSLLLSFSSFHFFLFPPPLLFLLL